MDVQGLPIRSLTAPGLEASGRAAEVRALVEEMDLLGGMDPSLVGAYRPYFGNTLGNIDALRSFGLPQLPGLDPSMLSMLQGFGGTDPMMLQAMQSGASPESLMTLWASRRQAQQQAIQQVLTIQAQIQADAQKQQAQRWKIQQDVQTKIFEIIQDVSINRAKTADKMANQVDSYIRQ